MKNLIIIFSFFIFLSSMNIKAQEVVELKIPESDKVVIKLEFNNGSICDPQGKEGLTFMTSSMLVSGGTKEYTYSQIQDILFPMAAHYGVKVDKEVSTFTFQVHKDFLDKFYEILRGIMLTPSFTEEDFERVKSDQQVYVNQSVRASSDEEYSKKLLEYYLFAGTKYQQIVAGNSESVKSITLDDVRNHYKNFYTKNNLTIGIAGSYSKDFLAKLRSDMQQLSDVKPSIPELGKPLQPAGINVKIISKKDAFGSAIFMGFPMNVTRASDDFAALMVANSYLGEHRKSYGVLYNKIRETRSMNYGDYSYIEWYDNGGAYMLPPAGTPRKMNYFSMWIRPVQIAKQLRSQYSELSDVRVGHAHFAIRMAVRELDKLVKDGIPQKDFEATKTFLMSYIKLYTQRMSDQIGYALDSKFYGRKDYINEMEKLLAKLTKKDVDAAIKKYWQTENMYIAIVTDESEADALAESMQNNFPSPMTYSNLVKAGLPASVLAEDDSVAVYKMNIKSVEIIKSEDTFK